MEQVSNRYDQKLHNEDLHDIIAKPPSWLLKRGISFVFLTVLMILGLSALIRYPETVKANMKVNAINAPKVVVNRTAGNIIRILVSEGQLVEKGSPLAFMESTANHTRVLELLHELIELRDIEQQENGSLIKLDAPKYLQLGELQGKYQDFYQSFINYQAAISNGIYQRKRKYLLKEMEYLSKQTAKTKEGLALRQRELELAANEYSKYKTLAEKKVISPMELANQEVLYLNKQQPIQQTENSILSDESTMVAHNRELSELDNQINEEVAKFIQSLNSLISEIENWKKQYILTASTSGKVVYAGIIQENQYLDNNSEVFYINPGDATYYGEMNIPQMNMGKVRVGQQVHIKLKSYPFQEYGYINGQVISISDIPVKDSIFLSQVKLIRSPKDSLIRLKAGIQAEAEIITEDKTVLQRIWMNVMKSLDMG